MQRDCDAFYGNPRGAAGRASGSWEAGNITRVVPPFVMRYDGNPVRAIAMHRKCAGSFMRVLNRIWEAAGQDQATVDAWGASTFAGSYVFRAKRGGGTLSMHAYGCAIDLDPARNGFHDVTPNFGIGSQLAVVRAFEAEGWEWGGRWKGRSCDGMHFQAARTSPVNARTIDISLAQSRLRELAYAPGAVDGQLGNLTVAALASFKDAAGLPVNDELDEDTMQALGAPDAPMRPVSPGRAAMTAADLRESGSRTIIGTMKSKSGAIGAGLATVAGFAAETQGIAGQVQEVVTGVQAGAGMLDLLKTYWPAAVIILAAGAAAWFAWQAYAGAAISEAARVDDARTGKNSER
jgi:hypothetical protein